MKSKLNSNKKSKRSTIQGFDNKNGLKPVKSKSGKANKKISIYDDLDDDLEINTYSDDEINIDDGLDDDD